MCEWSEYQNPKLFKSHSTRGISDSKAIVQEAFPTLKNKLPLSKRSIIGKLKRISLFCTQPNLTIPYLLQKIRNACLTAKMTELELHHNEIFSNL